MTTINVDELADEIKRQLLLYEKATLEDIQISATQVANACVKRLEETSPKNTSKYAKHSGQFSRLWRNKLETGNNYVTQTVYNYQARLTHLLEYGHALVRGGRTVGKAAAHPFIYKAEQDAITTFENLLKRRIKERDNS